MDRMRVAPIGVRREREDTDQPSDQIVGAARSEKRVVSAVVLNHEQAHEKPGRREREEEGDPITVVKTPNHESPDGDEWHHGDEQLEDAAPRARLGAELYEACPLALLSTIGRVFRGDLIANEAAPGLGSERIGDAAEPISGGEEASSLALDRGKSKVRPRV